MSDMLLTVDELLKILDGYEFDNLHVHHTYLPSHKHFTGDNYQALQDGMRNYHMNTLGWSDIGQHITLFPNGMVITGRDFNRTPASISGHNEGAFAVEMIGNFDKGNDVFKGDQKDAMIRIAKYFDDHGRGVIFHNEHSTKTCPGSSIVKSEFMGEVRAYGVVISDDEVSPWADEAREWCISKGITDGETPKATCTREEIWTMIHRYHNR